ncbi:MAG: response regulator [Oscillospiraceae bacterium]|nr:response regulator [Oscillospiraceae bacterium]
MQKTIFVVDDSATNLSTAEKVLENHYRVITLSSAVKMFTILEKVTPDLILLDIEMPDMSGFEAMKRLKSGDSYSEIPVIFLTALTDAVNEAHGIELGAVDFIVKPFSEPVLLNRIKNHLSIDELIRERTTQLRERTEKLVQLQSGIVYGMADLVESRDANTGGHIDRTTEYYKILLDAMYAHGIYPDDIRDWNPEAVVSSAHLHDLGKICIPDSILNKPGLLSRDEFNIMKGHAAEGERIIDKMATRTGEAEFWQYAKMCAGYHHERWDGSGYPYGLSGSKIPLPGRIMAIVDVYDALTSDRPYKQAFSSDEAMHTIRDDSGKHFDPLVAELFYEIKSRIEAEKIKLSSRAPV